MSGFITTMFVSSAPHFCASFPADPKPLRPIFTFAQCQSCMDIRVNMMEDKENRLSEDFWFENSEGTFETAVPARPQSVYKSPLQRNRETLRTPPSGPRTILALDTSLSGGRRGTGSPLSSPAPLSSSRLQYIGESPIREFPNYSYKLLPGGNISPKQARPKKKIPNSSGQGEHVIVESNTVSTAAMQAQIQAPPSNGFFGATGLLSSLFSNPRTRAPFKPKSNRGTSSWQLKQYAEATLGSGSLRKAVKLPEGEDRDEWLAVNIVDFYNQINLLYGAITEFCSPQSCPEMKATDE